MRRDNHIGWDFAKLEMELKVRAYQAVFYGDELQFIESVYQFEERLAQATELRNNLPIEEWKDCLDHDTAEQRLFAILLGIRRQAKKCLEWVHKLNRIWLHEHYFLLACYGVYAGKFSTYRRRDLVAAYVAAGHAGGRYAWAQTSLTTPEKAAEDQAKQAIHEGQPAARLVATEPPLSHRPELVFAKIFTRSREARFVESGIEILSELRTRFPLALDAWQELALALFELADLTGDAAHSREAQRVLMQLESNCSSPHYETLCRWGRFWKDRGDEVVSRDGASQESAACYGKAKDYYQKALTEQDHYYPEINVATLLLLLGRNAEAEHLARISLARLEARPRDATEETMWVLATRAESHLILGQGEEAAMFYTQALLHPRRQPQHADAMQRQARRILRARPCENVEFDEVFRT